MAEVMLYLLYIYLYILFIYSFFFLLCLEIQVGCCSSGDIHLQGISLTLFLHRLLSRCFSPPSAPSRPLPLSPPPSLASTLSFYHSPRLRPSPLRITSPLAPPLHAALFPACSLSPKWLYTGILEGGGESEGGWEGWEGVRGVNNIY